MIRCEDTGEEVSGYDTYLRSKHWQLKKEEFKKHIKFKSRCPICKDKKKYFEVHHLTYERLGCELMEDLEIMCSACHAKHHGKSGSRHNSFLFTKNATSFNRERLASIERSHQRFLEKEAA